MREPAFFDALVMIAPSSCYMDDDGYRGGFSPRDIDELLEAMDANYVSSSATIATVIVSAQNGAGPAVLLSEAFCRTDPKIAREFAQGAFRANTGREQRDVTTPTLILQCADDALAPTEVSSFVHKMKPGVGFRCPKRPATARISQRRTKPAVLREFLDGR